MGQNGGKRAGAGRKKGFSAKNAEVARAYIVKRVGKELAPIIDKQIEQAKAGDDKARTDLFNRAYGRPKETLEVTGDFSLKLDV